MFRAFQRLNSASIRYATRSFSSARHVTNARALKPVAFVATLTIASYLYVNNNIATADAAKVDVKKFKADLEKLIADDEEKRGDGTSIGPTLVRLAWHASGTYSAKDHTGGSNGATMRFPPEATWGANAGLKVARDFLEPLKAKYNLSYADLWTLAGASVIEIAGGPEIKWRQGRTDSPAPTQVPDGRLPGADKGDSPHNAKHIREIFYRYVQISLIESVSHASISINYLTAIYNGMSCYESI